MPGQVPADAPSDWEARSGRRPWAPRAALTFLSIFFSAGADAPAIAGAAAAAPNTTSRRPIAATLIGFTRHLRVRSEMGPPHSFHEPSTQPDEKTKLMRVCAAWSSCSRATARPSGAATAATPGRTDVPLTDEGRRQAGLLARSLEGMEFARVLTSPLSRAVDTCRLAGLGDRAEPRDELLEWDYGEYEGLTTTADQGERPDWYLWRDGCPGGEGPDDVGRRVDDPSWPTCETTAGAVALFAHGHVLRVLAARWIGLAPSGGALLALATATVSVLGWERDVAVIRRWNMPPGTPAP